MVYNNCTNDFFAVLDVNHTGIIKTMFLRDKVLTLGQKLSSQEAEDFIAFADQDGDALITAEGETW